MSRKSRIVVRGPEGKRPFLRGMLTHSLIKQGLSFEEAFSVANEARMRLADKAAKVSGDLYISTEALRETVLRVVRDLYGKPRMRAIRDGKPAREPLVMHADGAAVPFSRGLLSQRLAATGLDPNEAYAVAHKVWQTLRQRPDAKIAEAEVLALERSTVVQMHGEEYGHRYDAVEHVANSSRPIVVLIGGATGCGKSTLATEVAYRLGIRKIASTDMIREIMRRLLSDEILPSIHTSSYNYRDRQAQEDPIMAGFLEQSLRVEVGIAAAIRRAVLENFHLVVEGVHLVPPMKGAMLHADGALVVPVVLATLDRAVLESRFVRRGKEQGGKRRAKRYLDSLDDIMRIQEHVLEQADQHDVPIIENLSFDEAATDLLRIVTDSLHRLRQHSP